MEAIKQKIKKGTFSGVIPMMGLFVMAAVMGFQSIPISQAISQELSDSFSDLSRISETKSYADLYFFNFVPNSATHSVNEITYNHGQIGGNVTWSYSQYGAGRDDINEKIDNVIKGELQDRAEKYFQRGYGGVSQRRGCTIPEMNYTAKLLPTPKGELKKGQVDHYDRNFPVLIRSEVPTNGEPAPIESECINKKGATRYVGDSRDSTVQQQNQGNQQNQNQQNQNQQNQNQNNNRGHFSFLPNYNPVSNLPWLGNNQGNDFSLNTIRPLVFDDFTSAGYTKQVNVTGNRYHIITGETAKFFSLLYGEWQDVDKGYGESPWTCSLGYSDYQTAVSNAESVVSSDISKGKTEAEDDLESDLPDGIDIKKSIITSSDELAYDVTASNFNGRANTGKKIGDCVCDCGKKCCYDEKKATATVYAENSRINFTLKDNKYRVLTENEWKHLEFNVNTYNQNYEYD